MTMTDTAAACRKRIADYFNQAAPQKNAANADRNCGRPFPLDHRSLPASGAAS